VTDQFDDQRFAALLKLAGPVDALELTKRLDEDLSRVAEVLAAPDVRADQKALHVQSHILLAISGTIGATRVFTLAQRLNGLVRVYDPGTLDGALEETRIALAELLRLIRNARAELLIRT
jgi:two-component system aerobic respiration control sensor histidine kinase ArcB